MKRPTMLILALVEEILSAAKLPAHIDVEVIQRRFEKEGEGFLSITLPAFCGAFELALENGSLTRSMVPWFGHHRNGVLPGFLSGLLKRVFSLDGTLLSEPCAESIRGIRQICSFYKKPKSIASPARNRRAAQQFIQTERDLERYDERCQKHDSVLRRVSDLLWGTSDLDFDISSIVCRHGPGATAEKLTSSERLSISHWPIRSLSHFPIDLHAIHNYGWYDSLDEVRLLEPEEEPPVRVVFVPKTMKSPRVIAIEPYYMQYMQQGLMNQLVPKLESMELTRQSIHFGDQSINRDLARRSSITKDRATLDLSEASDRVHNDLVMNIFQSSALLPFLQQCRSRTAQLPTGEVVVLRKFASMGSAMCFPVEAMVFYTLIQVALHYQSNTRPTRQSIRSYSKLIDVYGDDIIVPVNSRWIVEMTLEAFGLLVNKKKSFSKGNFRESCGGDYFMGTDVTPVYMRHHIPDRLDRSNPDVLMSLVSTSNQLYKEGYWKTCQTLRDSIEDSLGRRIPVSPYRGPGVYFASTWRSTRARWSSSIMTFTQERLIAVPVTVPAQFKCNRGIWFRYFDRTRIGPLDPWGTLSNVPCGNMVARSSIDENVKRGVFKLKRRWINAQIGVREV